MCGYCVGKGNLQDGTRNNGVNEGILVWNYVQVNGNNIH
jgi:hypothetical protein